MQRPHTIENDGFVHIHFLDLASRFTQECHVEIGYDLTITQRLNFLGQLGDPGDIIVNVIIPHVEYTIPGGLTAKQALHTCVAEVVSSIHKMFNMRNTHVKIHAGRRISTGYSDILKAFDTHLRTNIEFSFMGFPWRFPLLELHGVEESAFGNQGYDYWLSEVAKGYYPGRFIHGRSLFPHAWVGMYENAIISMMELERKHVLYLRQISISSLRSIIENI